MVGRVSLFCFSFRLMMQMTKVDFQSKYVLFVTTSAQREAGSWTMVPLWERG